MSLTRCANASRCRGAVSMRSSRPSRRIVAGTALVAALLSPARSISQSDENRDPYPGTELLRLEGDIASQLVEGVDRFLLRKIEESEAARELHWRRDFSSHEAYERSVAPSRARLASILGVRDERPEPSGLELVWTTDHSAQVGATPSFDVYAVRWPAFAGVRGEGLLLVPRAREPIADVVAIPDADQTPEQLAGLVAGTPPEAQFARRIAESGCRVIVPTLVDRARGKFVWGPGRKPTMTHREFLYRAAFELGRGLVGYEIQKVLAVVDWLEKDAPDRPVGVYGWGEGGLLALYSAALDARIDAAGVSGYFDRRHHIWEEPLDRNVFALLERFGDAELASLVAPRALVVEAAQAPELSYGGTGGGGPARIVTPALDSVRSEIARARALVSELDSSGGIALAVSGADGRGLPGSESALQSFLGKLSRGATPAPSGPAPRVLRDLEDPLRRLERTMREIDRHTQEVLRASPAVRKAFVFDRLDTSSEEAYLKSAEPLREFFAEEVIGTFSDPLLPANPRTRVFGEATTHTTYEVVLDVFPDVIAYGLLLVPSGIATGERRPVVVCQHGLEGRPQSVIGEKDKQYYERFATKLAERGFITFAPQNLYIFGDRFRTLQRKANPLKKTLFSIMVPQHQQIVDWLQSLPIVDPERIAFYGLSYGGKSAMRIPPLVSDYCLSICSADFNEWVDKNASTHHGRSYVWTGEYEIFEFDLGSTFNYAEMAALIAPRPFMVERGHYDGVADDWTVAWEFAKVRFLYQAQLKIGDRCAIEWFDGPHKINGKGTFEFLHRHLRWPAAARAETE